MTTIAYKDGILAGDQRLSGDSHIWHDKSRKVFRLRDGSLFGACGDNGAGEVLLRGLKKGVLCPELPKDAEIDAILVTAEGKVLLWEAGIWMKWPEPFVAIGSGRTFALAVMRLGHDAVTAVKAGVAGDVHSGGRVQTVKLKRKLK